MHLHVRTCMYCIFDWPIREEATGRAVTGSNSQDHTTLYFVDPRYPGVHPTVVPSRQIVQHRNERPRDVLESYVTLNEVDEQTNRDASAPAPTPLASTRHPPSQSDFMDIPNDVINDFRDDISSSVSSVITVKLSKNGSTKKPLDDVLILGTKIS